MYPYIRIFSFDIPTYGLISVLGVFIAGFVSVKLSAKRNLCKEDLIRTGIVAAVGLFAGAHMLYGITRTGDILKAFANYDTFDGFGDFVLHILQLFSGMVFFGGLYGGLFAGFIYAKKKRFPLTDTSDTFALFIPLFHAFGRVGCFFAGCCYGVKSEWGIQGRVIAGNLKEHTKRFPVQLLEALLLILLFFILFLLYKKTKARGKLIFIYLLIYSVLRFCLEYLRGDDIRGRLLMFSTSQWISLVTILWVSAYLIIKKYKKSKI